jgi:hypothetical protein|tara:strand:- start:297 stop:536 length:240 start_codon:yes stop_codon:yes gene_type:complete
VAIFCERYFPEILMASLEYKNKNYAKALEESFVEADYMLLSDEGTEKLKKIVLELKQSVRGPTAKLDAQEEKDIRSVPF